MSADERDAAYERYVAETVAALGKPTPDQIRRLQAIFSSAPVNHRGVA